MPDALDALEAATAGPDAIVRKSAGSAGSGRRPVSAGVAARATTDVRAVAVSLTPPLSSAVEAAVAKVAGRATAVAIALSVAVAAATALGRATAVVALVAAAAGRTAATFATTAAVGRATVVATVAAAAGCAAGNAWSSSMILRVVLGSFQAVRGVRLPVTPSVTVCPENVPGVFLPVQGPACRGYVRTLLVNEGTINHSLN